MRRTPLLVLAAGLAGLLVACPDTTSARFMTVLIENTVQTASGSTPCTGGLSAHTSSHGVQADSPSVQPGETLFWTAPIGTLATADPTTVQAACATGGAPGRSSLSVGFATQRVVRVAAPDGRAHDYVTQAPGPVIEVVR